MRRSTATGFFAAAAGLTAALVSGPPPVAAQGAPLSVALAPRTGTVEMGKPWITRITVRRSGRPYSGARPRLELHGPRQYSFISSRAGRGVFRARVVVARVGRFRLSVRVAGRVLSVGALSVSPGVTGALDIAFLPDGSLLVGDRANYVMRVDPGGRPRIVAGTGTDRTEGDGGAATSAAVGFPVEVAADPRGGFTIVSQERRIRRVAPDGRISTLAELKQPTAQAHDTSGNVYVSELAGRIRRIDVTTGSITTIAVGLLQPHGLVVDGDGTLVVCETFANRLVRIVPATGLVESLAIGLSQPVDIARAADGTFLVADAGNDRIARVARDGSATSVVDVPGPQSVAVDAAGLVYYTDRTLTRVLRVDPATGHVTTVLGPERSSPGERSAVRTWHAPNRTGLTP